MLVVNILHKNLHEIPSDSCTDNWYINIILTLSYTLYWQQVFTSVIQVNYCCMQQNGAIRQQRTSMQAVHRYTVDNNSILMQHKFSSEAAIAYLHCQCHCQCHLI